MQRFKRYLSKVLPKFFLDKLGFLLFRKQLFFQGTWPLWRAKRTLRVKARHPKSFTSKVLYKMAYDRNPLLPLVADKVQVRKFVEERIGSGYLPEIYGIIDQEGIDNFNPHILPRNFVLKANHGSGAVLIVSDREERKSLKMDLRKITWDRQVIHPKDFEFRSIQKLIKKWVGLNYYYIPGHMPEWAYKNIKPKILIEELLEGLDGGIPDDFKFFMFHGECLMILHAKGRMKDLSTVFYNSSWEVLPVGNKYSNESTAHQMRPLQIDEMLKVAVQLSQDFDFIRVDLYVTSSGIKFGELTNYPGGGEEPLHPESFDMWLGSQWNITGY